jgi:ElaB/YqjD/DUF883 family membrane-anchored ribosome-binding protein
MDTFPNAEPRSPGESAAAEHARRSVEEARASAQEIVSQGSEALHGRAARTRDALIQRTDQAAHYVQEQPMKSLLMAAAAGATIALLAGALSRHHSHHP